MKYFPLKELLKRLYFTLPTLVAATVVAENANQNMHSMEERSISVQKEKEWEIFATGDFLYYYITQDDLGAGYLYGSGSVSSFLDRTLLYNATELEPDFKWQPGFKVALGYGNHGQTPWELMLQYMQIDQNASVQATAPQGGSLQSSWVQYTNTLFPNATSIDAKWECKTKLLDFLAYHVFLPNADMVLKPMFGLRALWIDQKYNLTSNGTTIQNRTDVISNTTSDSWAIGLHGNIDSSWMLKWGLFLFNNVGASILYTDYEISRSEKERSGIVRYQGKYDENASRVDMTLQAGLGWQKEFAHNIGLLAKVTYDFSVFFNQNMMRNIVDGTISNTDYAHPIGNLYMQGLDIQVGLSY